MSEGNGSDIERLWNWISRSTQNRLKMKIFKFRVVLCRIRSFPTFRNKMAWVWTTLKKSKKCSWINCIRCFKWTLFELHHWSIVDACAFWKYQTRVVPSIFCMFHQPTSNCFSISQFRSLKPNMLKKQTWLMFLVYKSTLCREISKFSFLRQVSGFKYLNQMSTYHLACGNVLVLSLNCHFWVKITKMITRMNSWRFTNSPYLWFSRFSWKWPFR